MYIKKKKKIACLSQVTAGCFRLLKVIISDLIYFAVSKKFPKTIAYKVSLTKSRVSY